MANLWLDLKVTIIADTVYVLSLIHISEPTIP